MKRIRQGRSIGAAIGRVIKGGLVSAMVMGCAAHHPPARWEPPLAPTAQEIRETRTLIERDLVPRGVRLTKSGVEFQRASRIVSRLSAAAGADRFSFPVYVAAGSDDVNAMAVAGSTIVVYQELLKRVSDDDELAAVLGHEIGHIVARHSADNTARARADSVSFGSTLIGVIVSVASAAAGVNVQLADTIGDATRSATGVIGDGAYVQSYSREMELEADRIGLALMARAGFDPNAAVRFWEHADQVFGEASFLSFLGTHPSYSSRAEQLRELIGETPR